MIPTSFLLFHRGGGFWGIDSGQVMRIGPGAENLRVELSPGANPTAARPVALAADRVEGVVAGLAVRPMSAALRTFWPEAGFGVAVYSGRPVILLDPLHLPLPLVASGGPDA
ncbi:MAG TPA: hypothetical protein VGS22_06390 [Thermoanaerobaculia bacterium]|jgi:hypothetical protein|nr:hypothetical protein [Thermoanaerobaculia bacterium]